MTSNHSKKVESVHLGFKLQPGRFNLSDGSLYDPLLNFSSCFKGKYGNTEIFHKLEVLQDV